VDTREHLDETSGPEIIMISGSFLVAGKGWISTHMIDTVKEYSPEQQIHHNK